MADGAGAGIGGNGGKGGDSASRNPGYAGAGENCGDVNVFGSVEVYSYGGSGASGGNGSTRIGKGRRRWWRGISCCSELVGGGAGGGAGDTDAGGGGFSGGGGQRDNDSTIDNSGYNGVSRNSDYCAGGGSYFSIGGSGTLDGYFSIGGLLAGGGAYLKTFFPLSDSCVGGYGGYAGKGGNVYVEDINNVKAFNGSYITINSNNQTLEFRENNQSIIYAQLGYDINTLSENLIIETVEARTSDKLIEEFEEYNEYKTIDTLSYGLGIGSGAGCKEFHNGILIIK